MIFSYLYRLSRYYSISKCIIFIDYMVQMLLVAILQFIILQDHEHIHGPFQGTKVNNILTTSQSRRPSLNLLIVSPINIQWNYGVTCKVPCNWDCTKTSNQFTGTLHFRYNAHTCNVPYLISINESRLNCKQAQRRAKEAVYYPFFILMLFKHFVHSS